MREKIYREIYRERYEREKIIYRERDRRERYMREKNIYRERVRYTREREKIYRERGRKIIHFTHRGSADKKKRI